MKLARRLVLTGSLTLPSIVLAAGGCAHKSPHVAAPAPITTPITIAVANAPAAEPAQDEICALVSTKPNQDPEAATTCAPPRADLDALERRIACASPNMRDPSARVAWDHATPPTNLDLVERRFGLTAEERTHLMKDGIVVPSRLSYSSYAPALHDVYRSQLPVYVSLDAVMHAVYRSNDTFIASLESNDVEPRLNKALDAMHAALTKEAPRYPADTARDIDLYLTVARSLLSGEKMPSVLGQDREAAALVEMANAADGLHDVNVFGRTRVIDFAQMKPRGHYAQESAATNPDMADLSRYFRGAMWLSRLEWNVVSRSSKSSSRELDASETPREVIDAMALADLARAAGAMDDVDRIDGVWAMLAGAREDVSPRALLDLMASAGITDLTSADAPAKLRAQIGQSFVRTARTHYQAEGSKDLPVIATFLGPRITPDASATRPLVHPEVYERHEVPMTDIAFALGHDRALAYESDALAHHSDLKAGLDKARAIVMKSGESEQAEKNVRRADLYSAWLSAITAMSKPTTGIVPTFMETSTFADMRMNSAIAAYGQLRHNNILIVPVTYDEPGCEIPDGFVEPAPAVYGALIDYAERGAKATAQISEASHDNFVRLGRVLRVLDRIADRELRNQPLDDDDRRFLSMVTEISYGRRGGYSTGPQGSGWYFDMFRSTEDALNDASFIADYFASPYEGTAYYAGVSEVRMGLFVVDTAGAPRVFVGPVSRAFQATGPIGHRFTDQDVWNRKKVQPEDPWAASYTAAEPDAPPIDIRVKAKADKRDGWSGDIAFTATSQKDLGAVTIEITDHHHVPVATITHDLKKGQPVKFAFPSRKLPENEVTQFGVEGAHVKVGEWNYFADGTFLPTEYMPWDPAQNEKWVFGKKKAK
jgi:hypothetical protein